MPITFTLYDLHLVIQAAMGWTNSHLHGFFIDTTLYVDKEAEWEEGVDYDYEDERLVVVKSLFTKLPKQITYTYDFGDSWDHEIKFERYIDLKTNAPICVGGVGACPLEDVGGMGGYDEFLAAVGHPNTKANHEILDSYGYGDEHEGIFDPNAFDIDEVNSDLQDLFNNRDEVPSSI